MCERSESETLEEEMKYKIELEEYSWTTNGLFYQPLTPDFKFFFPPVPKPPVYVPVHFLQALCISLNLEDPYFSLQEEIKGLCSYVEVKVTVGNLSTTGSGTQFYKACQNGAESMVMKINANNNQGRLVKTSYKSCFEDQYVYEEVLGQGGYGIVLNANKKLTKCNVAIKRIKLPLNHDKQEQSLREVRVLANLSHTNVLKLNHAWIETPPLGWQAQQDKKNGFEDVSRNLSFSISSTDTEESIQLEARPMYLYIETEICRCDLRQWLDKEKYTRLVKDIFRQVLSGLSFLHENGIVHRDVKPSNIFFAKGHKNRILLGDFGLATQIRLAENKAASDMDSMKLLPSGSGSATPNIGTSWYMAPEQEKGSKYGTAVDVYALAFIVLELYFDLVDPGDRRETLTEARNGNVKNFEHKQIVKEMLSLNPSKRPDCQKILSVVFNE